MTEYMATIGLETHIQLNTRTKAFCSCSADSRNDPPNTNICPICSGQPGALPSPNVEMVRKALKLCLAVHADINEVSFFDRKNYLYADMPGGYQVSQFDRPIGQGGYLDITVLYLSCSAEPPRLKTSLPVLNMQALEPDVMVAVFLLPS